MKKLGFLLITFVLAFSLIFSLVPNAETTSTLSGVVTGYYGEILVDCTVAAFYDGGSNDGVLAASALTDNNGAFTLTLDNGDYIISYYSAESLAQSVPITIGGNMTLNLTSEIKLDITYPDTVQVGDIFSIDISLSNYTDSDLSQYSFNVNEPTLIKLLTDTSFTMASTPAGKTQTIKLKAVALVGGSEDLSITDDQGNEYIQEFFVSGPGYYAGDSHTHSNYYDGSGSIAENVEVARKLGLDWLYSTDHNMLKANEVAADINASYNGKFLDLVGTEITILGYSGIDKDTGHVLSYRVDSVVDGYPYPGAYTETRNRIWSATIASVIEQGGFAYIAHPYNELVDYNNNGKDEDYGFWMSDYEKYTTKNMTGVEVINWFEHTNFSSIAAFKYWDELNAKGEKSYYGISNTDAHAPKYVGMVYNKGYMESLTVENVNKLLESGSLYGTNGPDIRFEIDGINMGNTLYVTEPTTVRVHVQAYDRYSFLKNITIYKLQKTGDWLGAETKHISKYINLDGQNLNFFDGYFEMEVQPGEIYRMEAKSQLCHHPIIRIGNRYEGFAFSNPIWINQADNSNAAILESLTYSGNGSLVTTAYEIPFIIINEGNFDMNNLTVTVGKDTDYTATYTEGSSGKAGQLKLTLTAPDGSQKTLCYLVVSPAFS